MRLDPRDAVRFSALSSPDEILAGAANPYHAARPRRVSAAGLRPLQAKLSRNSNQIARGRIRQFESYMPSHAVWSLWAMYSCVPEGPSALQTTLFSCPLSRHEEVAKILHLN